MKIGIINNLT